MLNIFQLLVEQLKCCYNVECHSPRQNSSIIASINMSTGCTLVEAIIPLLARCNSRTLGSQHISSVLEMGRHDAFV